MKITNRYDLPPAFMRLVNWLEKPRVLPKGEGEVLSVTESGDSPRVVQLKRRHGGELEIDASDLVYIVRGKTRHLALQAGQGNNDLAEIRLSREFHGVLITGQPDLYDGDTFTLYDWKTTSVWKAILKDYDDWYTQVNVYGWLLRKEGFKVTHLRVMAELDGWSRRESKYKPDYPQTKVIVIDCPLWSDAKVEAHLAERIDRHLEAVDKPDDQLPMCTPEERWAKPEKWAVQKAGAKRAVRVFDAKEDAEAFIATASKPDGLMVEHRPGDEPRCKEYCDVCGYCQYWITNYAGRE